MKRQKRRTFFAIEDVLKKATGKIEVIVILDGYDTERLEGVRYILLPTTEYTKKRQGINQAVMEAKGEYIMCLDAHCMLDKGMDEKHREQYLSTDRYNDAYEYILSLLDKGEYR